MPSKTEAKPEQKDGHYRDQDFPYIKNEKKERHHPSAWLQKQICTRHPEMAPLAPIMGIGEVFVHEGTHIGGITTA
jgi:hypothetical protein